MFSIVAFESFFTDHGETGMKISNLTKMLGVGALSLSLTALPMALSASAQDASTSAGQQTTGQQTTRTNSDNDFDWGWLGLLGLLGLAGLAGKKRDDDRVAYRDPNVTTQTGSGTSYRQ